MDYDEKICLYPLTLLVSHYSIPYSSSLPLFLNHSLVSSPLADMFVTSMKCVKQQRACPGRLSWVVAW